MFKNNYTSRTQTQTRTQTPNSANSANSSNSASTSTLTNSLNVLTSTTNPNNIVVNSGRNDIANEIMFAILTSNLKEVKRLVNAPNVNNLIDNTNNYTALHHAVRVKGNNDIIEYLMSIGANPKIKQNEGKDSIDLSIEANYRFLIDRLLREKETELDKIYEKFDNVNYEYKNVEMKNKELLEENNFLKRSSSQYVENIETLKIENTTLKRKYDESEKAFANLLKKVKKN